MFTGKTLGTYIIEFNKPLIFYEDKNKNAIVSNRYNIMFPNIPVYKNNLYDMIRLNIMVQYAKGNINDATTYTISEWEEHLDAINKQAI